MCLGFITSNHYTTALDQKVSLRMHETFLVVGCCSALLRPLVWVLCKFCTRLSVTGSLLQHRQEYCVCQVNVFTLVCVVNMCIFVHMHLMNDYSYSLLIS